jgi:hypothetical protein
MKEPVPSQYLSLAGTLEFAKVQRKASSTLAERVWRPIYRALLEGALNAIGDFEDYRGKIFAVDQPVLPEDWRALRESEFVEACDRPHVLIMPNSKQVHDGPVYLTNVRIKTNQVRAWLGLGGAVEPAPLKNRPGQSAVERSVADYIAQSKAEGRRPTQSGAVGALSHLHRDYVRDEFKRQAEAKGIEVARGRPRTRPENSRP